MSDQVHQTDIEAIQIALKQTGELLHGIVSRSDIKQIAAEVLRLNEAVRRGAAGRVQSGDHPQDFAMLLLAEADDTNRVS
ncbi:MAG: hypothetical protein ACOYMH_01595 [Zwartia sp.]|jgi:hypothetical protein